MNDKDYLINSLEKKMSDFEIYYSKQECLERKFVKDTSKIVSDLRSHNLESSEKSTLVKAIALLKKIRERMR